MRYIAAPALLTLLLIWYVIAVGVRAFAMIGSGETVLLIFGIAALVIPALTLWFIVKEWRLAWFTEQMRKVAESQGLAIVDELPRSPGGRIDRQVAAGYVQELEAQVESLPEGWLLWYNLAWAYDAAGLRSQARGALVKASARFRVQATI